MSSSWPLDWRMAPRRCHALAQWAGDGTIVGVFAVLIGLPLALVIVQAFVPTLLSAGAGKGFDPSALPAALTDPRIGTSIAHSLLLAGLSSVTATLVGAYFAFILRRTASPQQMLR